METNPVTLRIASCAEDRERVYRFRYRIYVQEMGKRIFDADHQRACLQDDDDDGARLWMAEQGDELVATLRFQWGGEVEFSSYWRDVYGLPHFLAEFGGHAISLTSRLMVEPKFRGSSVLASMLSETYRSARGLGVRFDFINCTPGLVQFYESLGYRRFTRGFVDRDTGYHVPMLFVLGGLAHMRQVRSVFSRVARHYAADDSASEWFERHFPEHVTHLNKRLLDDDAFWQLLSEKLADDPTRRVGLLDGLSEEDAQQFLQLSSIMKFQAGDVLLRPGDIGDEMYVILSGGIEIRGDVPGASGAEKRKSLAQLGSGQIFGEIAFVTRMRRTAWVIAESEGEVLILSQAALKRMMSRLPGVTSRVLFNLSLVLCERLSTATQGWLGALTAAADR